MSVDAEDVHFLDWQSDCGVEAVARAIARALGHNDDSGMHWERYVLPARLLHKEFLIRKRE